MFKFATTFFLLLSKIDLCFLFLRVPVAFGFKVVQTDH